MDHILNCHENCISVKKKCTELDDFDAGVVRRIVHTFYDKSEYPTALLILNELSNVKKKKKCQIKRIYLVCQEAIKI